MANTVQTNVKNGSNKIRENPKMQRKWKWKHLTNHRHFNIHLIPEEKYGQSTTTKPTRKEDAKVKIVKPHRPKEVVGSELVHTSSWRGDKLSWPGLKTLPRKVKKGREIENR